MSRLPSDGSSRLKISAPQPYQPPARTFPAASSSTSASPGPYQSTSSTLPDPHPSRAPPRPVNPHAQPPQRPSRSARREAGDGSPNCSTSSASPNFPGGPSANGLQSQTPPQPQYRRPSFDRPNPPYGQDSASGSAAGAGAGVGAAAENGSRSGSFSTSDYGTREPQSGSGAVYGGHSIISGYNIPESPGSGGSGSNWEEERSHRTELIRMQQEQMAREQKLRGVVDAFKKTPSSSARGDQDRSQPAKPPRPQRNQDGAGHQGDSSMVQDRFAGYESMEQENLMLGSGGAEFEDVDAILRKIKRDWPFVVSKGFAPTSLALSLLEPLEDPRAKSAPKAHPPLRDFLQLHGQLSTALSQAVRNHYQAYAASLPTHRKMVDSLTRSQEILKETKQQLAKSKILLAGNAPVAAGVTAMPMQDNIAIGNWRLEMNNMRAREKNLRDMLKVLDETERLIKVPDRLESLIGAKRFLDSSVLLVKSLKAVDKREMRSISALVDLRNYLNNQLDTLTDILVEELQNHLYLKTVYTNKRWTAYQPVSKTQYDMEELPVAADLDTGRLGTKASQAGGSRLSKFLMSLAVKPSTDPLAEFVDDDTLSQPYAASRQRTPGKASVSSLNDVKEQSTSESQGVESANPEADSFTYMETVLESLAILGRLSYAMDLTLQRLPAELSTLVERTIEEVGERLEVRKLRGSSAQRTRGQALVMDEAIPAFTRTADTGFFDGADRSSQFRTQITGLQGNAEDVETLRDLFWTACSKITAVVEGHRVIYERGDYKDSTGINAGKSVLVAPLDDIIRPVQLEMRTLLSDYLVDRDRGDAANRRPLVPINEVLRDNKIARDRGQALFRFGDSDPKALTQHLDPYRTLLDDTLQIALPGLTIKMESTSIKDGALQPAIDRYAGVQDVMPHTLIVPPNPFNIVVIFDPCNSFIRRVKLLAPYFLEGEASSFGDYMDDFVAKLYLPQLEDKVIALYQNAVGGANAFTRDVFWRECSAHPIVKSATDVMALVLTLCRMTATAPFRKDDYSRLVVNIVVRYYQRCNSRYRELVSSQTNAGSLPLAADWAQRQEMLDAARDLRGSSDQARKQDLLEKLSKDQRTWMSDRILDPLRDLIAYPNGIQHLMELYQSLVWFIAELEKLKRVADDLFSPQGELPQDPMSNSVALPTSPTREPESLLLSSAMAQRFDAILLTYGQLSDMILTTIHLEIRCAVICHVQQSFSKGSYRLDSDSPSPDTHILDLTLFLRDCDGTAKGILDERDRSFVFEGIETIVDTSLVRQAKLVRQINEYGTRKIFRNIGALQQAMRSLMQSTANADLEYAQRYWSLYSAGPRAMLDEVQRGRRLFSFDEYNHMLNLQCNIDPNASKRQSLSTLTSHTATDANTTLYNDYLIDLHSYAMETDGDW